MLRIFVYTSLFLALLSYCNGNTKTREPRTKNCQSNSECADGYTCIASICQIQNIMQTSGEGETCTAAADCGPAFVCKNKVCTPQSHSGGPCDINDDCEMGLTCVERICRENSSE